MKWLREALAWVGELAFCVLAIGALWAASWMLAPL